MVVEHKHTEKGYSLVFIYKLKEIVSGYYGNKRNYQKRSLVLLTKISMDILENLSVTWIYTVVKKRKTGKVSFWFVTMYQPGRKRALISTYTRNEAGISALIPFFFGCDVCNLNAPGSMSKTSSI